MWGCLSSLRGGVSNGRWISRTRCWVRRPCLSRPHKYRWLSPALREEPGQTSPSQIPQQFPAWEHYPAVDWEQTILMKVAHSVECGSRERTIVALEAATVHRWLGPTLRPLAGPLELLREIARGILGKKGLGVWLDVAGASIGCCCSSGGSFVRNYGSGSQG